METCTDWSVVAGNGHCVPMPKTTTEISDHFVCVQMDAPEFTSLQRAVTYPLTLEMMFGVLRAAVANAASRCRGEDARTAYVSSLGEIDLALDCYRAGHRKEGSLRVQLAQHLFRWGALPRSRNTATRYVESIREALDALPGA
jgi:hypothetical protein